MKIYTRTGDDGTTALFGGGRVAKNDQRLAAYGTVDELNSALGFALTLEPPHDVGTVITELQNAMFAVGAELATLVPETRGTDLLGERDVLRIEGQIDQFEATLTPLKAFILPGGTPAAAALHMARCICRRAERGLVTLAENHPVRGALLQYLNRVSDLLFVLARATNHAAQAAETEWRR